MKKSLFTLIILLICGFLAAQFVVWRNGEIIFQTSINKVDSITLYELDLPDLPDDPNDPDDPDDPDNPDNPDDPDDPDNPDDPDDSDDPDSPDNPLGLPKVKPVEGAYVIVVQFQQKPCNDVIFAGGYKLADGSQSAWSKEPAAKFEAIEGYDGWYKVVVYPLDVAYDQGFIVRGKPVQLTAGGVFEWSYQWARNSVEVLDGDFILGEENGGEQFIGFTGSEDESKVVYLTSTGWATDPCAAAIPAGYGTFIVNIAEGSYVSEDATFSIAGNFAEEAWNNSRVMTEVEKGKKYIWTGDYPENFQFKVIQTVDGYDIWAEGYNAKFDGETYEYTFTFQSLWWEEPDEPIYPEEPDLKFYTMALMGMDENFYQIDGVDANEDGENDTIYAVTFYVLPESMYIDGEDYLLGDDDYMLIMNTAISVCHIAGSGGKGKVVYSLGGYTFSDVEEEYCVEIDGKKRLLPHAATYTHFDEEKYLTAYGMLMEGKKDEANAYIEENGYWMGDLDSYVAYVNFEYQSVVEAGYIVSGVGLECGSKGTHDLDFYEFGLKLFAKPYAYGLATEMVEDEETGEMIETFVLPLEMGEMVEKTYTFGERQSESEEDQTRISKQQRVKNNNFGAVPFDALKKQMAVNRMLFKPLNYKGDLRVR